MDCQEIFESLSDYIDEDLADRKCAEIERHLKDCYNCKVVVDTIRKTVTLYHAIPSRLMPEELRLKLHQVIRIEGL